MTASISMPFSTPTIPAGTSTLIGVTHPKHARRSWNKRAIATKSSAGVRPINRCLTARNGATTASLNPAPVSNTSSFSGSDLGARLSHSFDTRYGELRADATLTWRHEYQETRLQTTASFVAAPNGVTSFTTDGASPVTDSGVLALGATLLHGRNLSLSGQYEIEQASGFTSQIADLRLRWQF